MDEETRTIENQKMIDEMPPYVEKIVSAFITETDKILDEKGSTFRCLVGLEAISVMTSYFFINALEEECHRDVFRSLVCETGSRIRRKFIADRERKKDGEHKNCWCKNE